MIRTSEEECRGRDLMAFSFVSSALYFFFGCNCIREMRVENSLDGARQTAGKKRHTDEGRAGRAAVSLDGRAL